MTIDGPLLSRIGLVLYGQFWRAPLGERFGIGPRKLRRMVAGQESIGPAMALDIERELRDRGLELDAILDRLADA